MKCRYIPIIDTDAYTQMAIDEMLFEEVKEGKYDFILRFYTFSPIAITMGYHQKYERVKKKDCDIDIVRRITGGRAVYHSGDITYSVTANSKVIGTTGVEDTYKLLSSFFAKAFKAMGVPVEMVPPRGSQMPRSELCFASTSMYEFVLKGQKIMGSAQYRDKDIFLQQGTILLYRPEVPVNKVMNVNVEEIPSVESLTNNKVDYKRLVNNVKKYVEDYLDNEFNILEITDEEKHRVKFFRNNKYASEDWNINKVSYHGFRSK